MKLNNKGLAPIVIILITAIVFLVIAGGGVWYWQDQQMKKQKQDSEKQVQDLKKQVEDLRREKEQAISKNNQSVVGPNTDKEIKIKVGDKVGEMVAKSIKPFSQTLSPPLDMPLSTGNVQIKFSGQATIKGIYKYHGDDEPFNFGTVCFYVLDIFDKESLGKIPRLQEKNENWFCFSNQDFARNQFGPKGSSGAATIVIDEYTINSYPSEVWDLVKLVKIISKY